MDRTMFEMNSKSLAAKHLKILELDEGALTSVSISDEVAYMDKLDLPELRLPAKRRPLKPVALFTIAVLAASLLLVLWKQKETESDYTFKGSSKILVYYRSGDEIVRFDSAQKLSANTPIRVSIIPSTSGKAYISFYNRDNSPITALDEMKKHGLSTQAGKKAIFAGSFQLTEENVGERAVVVICSTTGSIAFEKQDTEQTARWIKQLLENADTLDKSMDCHLASQKLRL